MNTYPNTKLNKQKVQRFVAAVVLLSWLVLGNGGLGLALATVASLQIQGERITGALHQVPLRMVLAQLQEKLAIDYVVPNEELDTPISANFSGELVNQALSKILASWDYALQVDHQGRVQQIFVVAKMKHMSNPKNAEMKSEPVLAVFPRVTRRSESLPQSTNLEITPSEAAVLENDERVAKVSPMLIESSEKLRPMVFQPSQAGSMNIQLESTPMEIIPASGYVSMEILPASKRDSMAFE